MKKLILILPILFLSCQDDPVSPYDECGVLNGDNASMDECGVCDGDNSTCSTTGILGGCDLPVNTLVYDFNSNEVWYKVDFDIKAFSWNIYPDSLNVGASYGGEQENFGFNDDSANSEKDVYAWVINSWLTEPCGNLIYLDFTQDSESIDFHSMEFYDIVFTNSSGSLEEVSIMDVYMMNVVYVMEVNLIKIKMEFVIM